MSTAIEYLDDKLIPALEKSVQSAVKGSVQGAEQHLKNMLRLQVSVTAKAMSMIIANHNMIQATEAINVIDASTSQAIANFKRVSETAANILSELSGGGAMPEPPELKQTMFIITPEVLQKLTSVELPGVPSDDLAMIRDKLAASMVNKLYLGTAEFIKALQDIDYSIPAIKDTLTIPYQIPDSVLDWLCTACRVIRLNLALSQHLL